MKLRLPGGPIAALPIAGVVLVIATAVWPNGERSSSVTTSAVGDTTSIPVPTNESGEEAPNEISPLDAVPNNPDLTSITAPPPTSLPGSVTPGPGVRAGTNAYADSGDTPPPVDDVGELPPNTPAPPGFPPLPTGANAVGYDPTAGVTWTVDATSYPQTYADYRDALTANGFTQLGETPSLFDPEQGRTFLVSKDGRQFRVNFGRPSTVTYDSNGPVIIFTDGTLFVTLFEVATP